MNLHSRAILPALAVLLFAGCYRDQVSPADAFIDSTGTFRTGGQYDYRILTTLNYSQSWRRHWEQVIPFFAFSAPIRRRRTALATRASFLAPLWMRTAIFMEVRCESVCGDG